MSAVALASAHAARMPPRAAGNGGVDKALDINEADAEEAAEVRRHFAAGVSGEDESRNMAGILLKGGGEVPWGSRNLLGIRLTASPLRDSET